jgi:hypothetical protein
MLVALVLLGLVMTLVSQAMFQAAQIARAADDSTRTLTQRWAGGWGLVPLVANLAAPPEQTEPWFDGSPQRIAGWSTAPLSAAGTGVERFELIFRADPDDNTRSQLVSRQSGFGAAVEVVAVFAGRAEFEFVDRAQRSGTTWPPLARGSAATAAPDAEQLPRAVVVRDTRSGQVLMRYAFLGESAKPVAPGRPFWEMTP